MMMGETAAVLCALAKETKRSLREVAVSRLQESLVENGALLDSSKLPDRPAHWRLGEIIQDAAPPIFYGGVK